MAIYRRYSIKFIDEKAKDMTAHAVISAHDQSGYIAEAWYSDQPVRIITIREQTGGNIAKRHTEFANTPEQAVHQLHDWLLIKYGPLEMTKYMGTNS